MIPKILELLPKKLKGPLLPNEPGPRLPDYEDCLVQGYNKALSDVLAALEGKVGVVPSEDEIAGVIVRQFMGFKVSHITDAMKHNAEVIAKALRALMLGKEKK